MGALPTTLRTVWGWGARRPLRFRIPEKRPLPSPISFSAFRRGPAPTPKCGWRPLPQPQKVMTFPGCALAPPQPPLPNIHSLHWEGVGGDRVDGHTGERAGVVHVRRGGRLAPSGAVKEPQPGGGKGGGRRMFTWTRVHKS